LNCPACGSLEARIARTIMGPAADIRQRRCRCGVSWQTVEKVVKGTVQVKLAGEIVPRAQVKRVAAQETAQGEKGGKGVSSSEYSSQPLSSDQDSNSSLLGKPRARRGRPTTKGYTPGFLRFWDAISPRCGNKEPAFKAWVKFECENHDGDFIVEQYMLRASTSKWKRGYAQHVATWLNEKGWETEPDPSEYDNGVPEKIQQSRDSARTWAHRSAG
jgi:hypothetical protein